MSTSTKEFGSKKVTDCLWDIFNEQLSFLADAKDAGRKNEKIDFSVHALIYSVLCSGQSLSLLAEQTNFRDCYIIGRSIFETLLNAAFILSEGKAVASQAYKHAQQKIYRNLERDLKVGKKKIILRSDPGITPDKTLTEALNDFTSKKGREITSWTQESLISRIESIEKKYGESISGDFQFALFAIYRHASELAHGTLSGALFSIGLEENSTPPSSQAAYDKFRRGHICMILIMLSGCISSLIQIICIEMGINEIALKSKKIIDKVKEKS